MYTYLTINDKHATTQSSAKLATPVGHVTSSLLVIAICRESLAWNIGTGCKTSSVNRIPGDTVLQKT